MSDQLKKNNGLLTNEALIVNKSLGDLGSLDKVNEALMEQMEKLKGNPAEIEITEAMCGLAGRIIDVAKTKIAAASLIIKAQGT